MMRRLLVGAAVGAALLLAALAGVESLSEWQHSNDLPEPAAMPASVTDPPPQEIPSAPELSDIEGFAHPTLTR
jgi:hypothetical protein